MSVQIEVLGYNEILKALHQANEIAVRAVNIGIWEFGHKILADALPLTPLDTGALRASGNVFPGSPQTTNVRPEYTVGFGGPSAPYALIVHERTDIRHPVGQAKFLEAAFNANVGGYKDKIAASVRAQLKANSALAAKW
jgi:hypothetical protein